MSIKNAIYLQSIKMQLLKRLWSFGSTKWINAIIFTLLCFGNVHIIFASSQTELVCSKNCTCTADILICSDRNLTELSIPHGVNTVKLVRILITNLTTSMFENSHNLGTLILNYDGITHLDFDCFNKVIKIEILDLANNAIEYLDKTVFKSLTRLKKLVLQSNSITEIPVNLFSDLTNLEEINISNNRILSTFSSNIFKDVTKLQSLDLSINQISYIEPYTFEHCNYLRFINISHNNVKDIKNIFKDLENLNQLDVSHNQIQNLDKHVFEDCSKIEKLFLNNNKIEFFHLLVFQYLENLKELKINDNPLKYLPSDLFFHNLNMRVLDMSNLDITDLNGKLLRNLNKLNQLSINKNRNLKLIDNDIFLDKPKLRSIDLSFNQNIQKLPVSLISISEFENLNLRNLKVSCDCQFTWFLKLHLKLKNQSTYNDKNFTCLESESKNLIQFLKDLKCDKPEIIYHSRIVYYELLTSAMLDCITIGSPEPAITWYTPNGITLHDRHFNMTNHPKIHNNQLVAQEIQELKIMDNGSLSIEHVMREDVGNYTCLALNINSNTSVIVTVRLDPEIFDRRQFYSFAVGIFCALIFLLITILVQSVIFVCKRCGWKLQKQEEGSPKTNIHHVIETVEQYRAQQLEKLRENYTLQVKKIKDNCAQQTEWIWESYHQQVKNLKDIKDYGASHLTSIKEQYSDQVRKVRDYTASQLNKVKENYIFQRNKIRKFSAHQILRFRENCKYQQQAFNKVFENLPNFNIENCKNGCGQSVSEINLSCYDEEESFDKLNVQATEGETLLEEILPTDLLLKDEKENLGRYKKKLGSEMGSSFSIYFTPTDTTDSPASQKFFNRLTGVQSELNLIQSNSNGEDTLNPSSSYKEFDNYDIELKIKNNSIPSVHESNDKKNNADVIINLDENVELHMNSSNGEQTLIDLKLGENLSTSNPQNKLNNVHEKANQILQNISLH